MTDYETRITDIEDRLKGGNGAKKQHLSRLKRYALIHVVVLILLMFIRPVYMLDSKGHIDKTKLILFTLAIGIAVIIFQRTQTTGAVKQ